MGCSSIALSSQPGDPVTAISDEKRNHRRVHLGASGGVLLQTDGHYSGKLWLFGRQKPPSHVVPFLSREHARPHLN